MNEHDIRTWLKLHWGNDKQLQLAGVKDDLKHAVEDDMSRDDKRIYLTAKALLEAETC